MGKSRYPDTPLQREHLRTALRRRGRDTTDEIAAGIREQWNHGHIRSYRLALELSLEQVCGQVNRILGVFPGAVGHLDHSTLSKLERWPNSPRRPTVGQIVALAHVFGTTPRHLIADVDWDKYPPADQLAIQALDTQTNRATTEPIPAVGMMDTTRPPAGTRPGPHTPWARPDQPRSGTPSERDILVTGEESAQYAEHGSNIGDMTLDQLRAGVAVHAGKFANASRVELFTGVRLLRDRIFSYLDGGQPIRQRKDLYFLAGAACGLLAGVSDDLGYATAAMSHARAGHVFAMEAGEPALTGWLYAVQANICYWNGQPGKAREYARRGAALHPAGTVGVWLPSIEARACGELRDTTGVGVAVHNATETRELVQPGPLDEFGGQLGFSQGKQHFYAAGAYLGISDDTAVITQANAAVDAYAAGPPQEYDYINTTNVRFHAAIAHVRSGDLDAAQESAQTALNVAPEHRTAQIDKSARRLHTELSTATVRISPLAIGTRDQIEDFLSLTPARLELS